MSLLLLHLLSMLHMDLTSPGVWIRDSSLSVTSPYSAPIGALRWKWSKAPSSERRWLLKEYRTCHQGRPIEHWSKGTGLISSGSIVPVNGAHSTEREREGLIKVNLGTLTTQRGGEFTDTLHRPTWPWILEIDGAVTLLVATTNPNKVVFPSGIVLLPGFHGKGTEWGDYFN